MNTLTASSEAKTIPITWAAFELSKAVGRPVTDRTIAQAAGRLGALTTDNLGRQAIPIDTYEQMKASYVSTGYYSPRHRGAPFKTKEVE
jgi:hypothetical protein